MPRMAVILAAGMGSRLGELAAGRPKCLVSVGGEPLIRPMLRSLDRLGIERIVIVVGYRADAIEGELGRELGGARVCYVEAPDYETTNNIVSLWRARSLIDPPFFLLEADLILERAVLEALAAHAGADGAMAVAPFQSTMNGTVVRVDSDGLVTELIVAKAQHEGLEMASLYKTVNAYLLGESVWRDSLLPAVARRIDRGELGDFYESAFGDEIAAGRARLRAVDIGTESWVEVDTPEDLGSARRLLARLTRG